MNSFFDHIIEKQGCVILDGALPTELEKRGANLNHALWSAKLLIENPTLIKQVHLDYLHAGADIITTSTYQASFDGFAKEDSIGIILLPTIYKNEFIFYG
jgi:homocysteine S-methyltransferase